MLKKKDIMISLILWLPLIGFLGGSFCGRHMGRLVFFFTSVYISVFILRVNVSKNKICTLIISPWIIFDTLGVNKKLYLSLLVLYIHTFVTESLLYFVL